MGLTEILKRLIPVRDGLPRRKTEANQTKGRKMEEQDEIRPIPAVDATESSGPAAEEPTGQGKADPDGEKTPEGSADRPAAGGADGVAAPEESPAAPGCETVLRELTARVAALETGLGGRLEDMRTGLKEALSGPYGKMADAVRRYAEVTDNMDEELKAFRKGLVRKLEQELFQEWFDLYDALRGAAEEAGKAPEKAGELLEGFRTWIEGVLENRKCVKKEAVAGERFDGRKHRVWGERVPTRDAALDGRVAETAKPGFDDEHEMYGGLPDKAMHLRPIHVRLYKYIPETESPSPALAGEGEDGGDGPAE